MDFDFNATGVYVGLQHLCVISARNINNLHITVNLIPAFTIVVITVGSALHHYLQKLLSMKIYF